MVDNYHPDLCELTMPNLKQYADNIGADFIQIKERKFKHHAAYEKLQAYEISEHYDKTILIDADIIVHPRMPDLTNQVNMDMVGIWMQYPITSQTLNLWETKDDPDFMRHGGNFGVVGSLLCCTKWTRDIFKPLVDVDVDSMQTQLYRPAIIDEYAMSKNLARYNLKYNSLSILPSLIYHAELTTINNKNLDIIKDILKEWT